MKVFQIEIVGDESRNHYEGTQTAAHKRVKERVDKSEWPKTRITEVDVQTDKLGVIAMLNNDPIILSMGASLGITKRGGLEPWAE